MKQTSGYMLLLVVVFLTGVSRAENFENSYSSAKNYSSENNNTENFQDNVFKTEAMKVIGQCRDETSGNDKQAQSRESNAGSNNYNKTHNNYSNQGNWRNTNDRQSNNNSRYDYNADNNSYKNNNYNNNPYNHRTNEDYNSNGFGNSYNPNDNRGQSTYHDGYESGRSNQYNSYRGGELGNDNYYGGAANTRDSFGARTRRSDMRNDNQCVSQCVFGYMELLDENRIPSETLVIRWLQDHIANNDLKRIKALRETRRCFARLSTSDVEDGCDFSKRLSKCMDLDVE